MKKIVLITLLSFLLVGCGETSKINTEDTTFKEAHDNYKTVLTEEKQEDYDTPIPPKGIGLELVQYDSKVGQLDAYVSVDPQDGEKHPIVIWVVGGWGNSIDEFVWTYNEWENDQSGQFISEAGILMMYPSFRGGNQNPGYQETLFGEVDDIYSAYEYAKSLPYVDPERIYLVGHSTGGTRVLLASEYDDKFRAVVAFGPADDISKHNISQFTFDLSDKTEAKLRSPKYWMQDVKTPTFVIEGDYGNSKEVMDMRAHTDNTNLHFYIVEDSDHFEYLAPVTKLLADKILEDNGDDCNIQFTEEELSEAINQDPITTYPKLRSESFFENLFTMDIPAYWTLEKYEDEYLYYEAGAEGEDRNFWNSGYVDVRREMPEKGDMQSTFDLHIQRLSEQFEFVQASVDGVEVYQSLLSQEDYTSKILIFHDENYIYSISYGYYEEYSDIMKPYIDEMINSINFQNNIK